MSILHIIFKFNLNLYGANEELLDTVTVSRPSKLDIPNSISAGIDMNLLHKIITDVEKRIYDKEYEWINYMVEGLFHQEIASYVDVDYKYHIIVDNNGPILPQYLANSLKAMTPEGDWTNDNTEAIPAHRYPWSKIEIIPVVESVYVMTQTMVDLPKLPNPN